MSPFNCKLFKLKFLPVFNYNFSNLLYFVYFGKISALLYLFWFNKYIKLCLFNKYSIYVIFKL